MQEYFGRNDRTKGLNFQNPRSGGFFPETFSMTPAEVAKDDMYDWWNNFNNSTFGSSAAQEYWSGKGLSGDALQKRKELHASLQKTNKDGSLYVDDNYSSFDKAKVFDWMRKNKGNLPETNFSLSGFFDGSDTWSK